MRCFKRMILVCILASTGAFAQIVEVTAKPLTDSDIQLLRENIQAKKNDIVTKTMQFTEAESSAFWPVYQQYAREQREIGDKRLALVADYAKNYATIDDTMAHVMVQRLFEIENATQRLREKYLAQFEKALGAKRAAKFYQVDSRLTMMVNIQLASAIPLIP